MSSWTNHIIVLSSLVLLLSSETDTEMLSSEMSAEMWMCQKLKLNAGWFSNIPPTTVYNSVQQHTTVYNSIQQHTTVYNSIQLCTTTYNRVQQHTTVYNSIQQCTTPYNIIWQCTAAYSSIQQCKTCNVVLLCCSFTSVCQP